MKIEQPGRSESDLTASLILVTSVIVTVVVALFLAFSDDLQTRLPAPVRPTTVSQISEQIATAPPTATPTPSPTNSPTAPPGPTITPTPTSVSIVAEAGCGQIPGEWKPVTVGPNDTLYMLSAIYGGTVSEIMRGNCLDTTTIFRGSIIYVPSTYPIRPNCGPPAWWQTYIVRRGDTLSSLAWRHHTTIFAIMNANCMNSTRIDAGRKIFLPPLPATVTPPPTVVLPTDTPTATATATLSPPPTPVETVTVPPPPTATSSSTPISPTPTVPPTATETPVSTATPTEMPPASPTATALPSATATAVPTATPTLPPTSTPTNTPVPTDTPSPTNTPAPTATNPPTPSATSPPTATATPLPFESS